MTPVSSEDQLDLLGKLANEFSRDLKGFTVAWERGGMQAGVYTHQSGARVFFNGAERDVLTLDDARDVLSRVFADQVVCVTGLRAGSAVYSRLAPAEDPAATLPSPGVQAVIWGQRTVPDVDDIAIESWSRGAEDKA